MDPVRHIVEPMAEVRKVADRQIDEFGEQWVVIDGIETKVPNLKAARALLDRQDKLRVQIRADLDAAGIRFNPDGTDREEQVEIILEDGTKTTVGLMKPGDANYMQIGKFGDEAELNREAQKAQDEADRKEAEREREFVAMQKRAALAARSPLAKIKDAVMGFLGKDTQ